MLITKEFLKMNGFTPISENNSTSIKKLEEDFDYILIYCENYYIAVRQVRENLWNAHVQGDSGNYDGGIVDVEHLKKVLFACSMDKLVNELKIEIK